MSAQNRDIAKSPRAWSSLAKSLHWLTVLLILAEVPSGFLMSFTYPLSLRDKEGLALHYFAAQIHHTNGFLIFFLTGLRLILWIFKPHPATQPVFRYQTLLSRFTHLGLCVIMIALPLSGWAALSVLGDAPTWFLNRSDIVPRLVPQRPFDDPHGYGYFANLHVWFYCAGAALLIVHIAASLWHHLILRDAVFLKMWPFAKSINDRSRDPLVFQFYQPTAPDHE